MKPVNVNGVILTEDALEELMYLQTGGSLENPDPNIGLDMKIGYVDHATNFLIEISEHIDDDSKRVLEILRELVYIRNSFKKFSIPKERIHDGN